MGRRRGRRGRPVDGVLLVDKPQGLTSHDVVQRVRRAFNAQKAGHTGTLDPMATGLMEVCLGRATRLVPFLTAADKRYEATLRLGVATETLDAEGAVTAEDAAEAVAAVDQAALEAALPAFRGDIEQRPPAYSAIKVDGKPLYERARAGEEVEVPVRQVTVHAFELSGFASPDVRFSAHVSKGTYIRTLGADLAGAVGLNGHLVQLRRTTIGAKSVADAVTLEVLAEDENRDARLISLADAVAHLPAVHLDAGQVQTIRFGQTLQLDPAQAGQVRALDPEGHLVAIVQIGADGVTRVERGFPPPAAAETSA